jgi:thiosulfate/3-mercaptopyruvate sulfurtransferase
MEIAARGYEHPEALVSTQWVFEHLDDPEVRIVESNEDPLLYSSGHVPGAVEVDWVRDLNDPLRRDYLDRDRFERLMSRLGVSNDTLIVLYGDRNNWWATYAFWVFQLYGHTNCRIMDGGRLKWSKEGRPLVKEVPQYAETEYKPHARVDHKHRAFRDEVLEHVKKHKKLIDVRTPEEFSGERVHLPDFPNEGALRGGHIPGARNVPWARAVNPDDGTFLDAASLRAIYEDEANVHPNDDLVVYCRIGERSSHTWFVLRYLLGFRHVRNYDGSWTEWGNMVGVPIER